MYVLSDISVSVSWNKANKHWFLVQRKSLQTVPGIACEHLSWLLKSEEIFKNVAIGVPACCYAWGMHLRLDFSALSTLKWFPEASPWASEKYVLVMQMPRPGMSLLQRVFLCVWLNLLLSWLPVHHCWRCPGHAARIGLSFKKKGTSRNESYKV